MAFDANCPLPMLDYIYVGAPLYESKTNMQEEANVIEENGYTIVSI